MKFLNKIFMNINCSYDTFLTLRQQASVIDLFYDLMRFIRQASF